MLQRVSEPPGAASRNANPATGNDSEFAPASGSDNPEWLYDAAWAVFGKEAGAGLHYATGYPLSTCAAYVAHDPDKRRRASEHFVRRLIHSKQGAPFHAAFMHGCTADWWLEYQRYKRMGEAAERAR